jgi:peptidoglycan hydrolase-like protein with peptidoglycan-binding domain
VLATKGSVGQSGNNFFEDTKLIQSMLNNVPPKNGGPTTKLAVDASPGPLTIAAIKRFQTANACVTDGRVDARGKTIHALVNTQITSGAPLPRFAGLRAATTEEVAPILNAANFPTSRIGKAVPTAQTTQGFAGQPVAAGSLAVRGSSGFGAPFTRSGFIIENSVGSFDFTVKDTGGFVARMTIFREDDPSDRFNLTMAGVIKTAGLKDGSPVGFDFATPAFTSTTGVLFRGLFGFGPISRASFAGLCGIAFAGVNAPTGHGVSTILFQFQWVPVGPPGANTTFAIMAGVEKGVPGPSAGGGSTIAIPV